LEGAVKTTVSLLADGGATSAAPEFFRCKEFLALEGVTHTLTVESSSGCAAIPVIQRSIPNSEQSDAVSPYGYPGGVLTGSAPDLSEADLSHVGIVSLFLRDRVGLPTLQHGSARSPILIHNPLAPRRMREAFARNIRKNEREGYTSETIHGRDVNLSMLNEFRRCYVDTMRRVNATSRYFYSLDYLAGCLSFDGSWLVLTRGPDSIPASAMIIVRSDGALHYYLGGTADAHQSSSPAKNVYSQAIRLADQLALPLNFGGGVKAGDGLEDFKRGFSNEEEQFVTHELICEPSLYAQLSGPNSSGAFFPAYRAPI
jgi:Acetyltransferase (GNAT) domain